MADGDLNYSPSLAERLQMLAQYGGPENYDPRLSPIPGEGFDPVSYYRNATMSKAPLNVLSPEQAVNRDPSRQSPFIDTERPLPSYAPPTAAYARGSR